MNLRKDSDTARSRPKPAASRAFHAVQGEHVDIFVYGTLLHDQYLRRLLRRNVESVPAILYNYMRISPSWSFPFVVMQRGAKTQGKVLRNISRDELAILDEFESIDVLYRRQRVVVRTDSGRQRCFTYIGNIEEIERSAKKKIKFEERYSHFIEKKIDGILEEMPSTRSNLARRVLRELMGSTVDNIIESHFEGNYICNHIMKQALKDASPPRLVDLLKNQDLVPYAHNYMKLACQHIIFNQIEERVSHEYTEAVRVSEQYYRHGIGILIALIFYNRHKGKIETVLGENGFDSLKQGWSYRDYATCAIGIADSIYNASDIEDIIRYIEESWISSPTPMGAELEFSDMGARTIYAKPGEEPRFDCFNWFYDFDMLRRTWKLGGHVDSHRQMAVGQARHRGFLEYALGRFEIIGDLSRPICDSPAIMSLMINELVKFLDIRPHSLHVSMELRKDSVTDALHREEDLACLLMLGGDLSSDENGVLREQRIYSGSLDTNYRNSLNFSDRKHHFYKSSGEEGDGAEVMEYKYMRLHKGGFDYEMLISALKGYQFATQARPLSARIKTTDELPEQRFMREWAESPAAVDPGAIASFADKVREGLSIETSFCKPGGRVFEIINRMTEYLYQQNKMINDSENR